MRVAVLGGGISGLVSAYFLAKNGVEVDLYEKEDYLGGHAKTVAFNGVDFDIGFMVFNSVTYPNMMELFESLGVEIETSEMSFSVPICGSIWSCPSERVMSFSAYSVLSIFRNHHLLQIFGNPQWLTIKGQSHYYVKKVREELESRGCRLRTRCEVQKISTNDEGCMVLSGDGSEEVYSGCILAVHAPDAMRILGDKATPDELRVSVLSNMSIGLNSYISSSRQKFNASKPSCMECMEFCRKYRQQSMLDILAQCASGYGLYEGELKAGIASANGILGERFALLSKFKPVVPSLIETGARRYVTRFLRDYISNGCLILLEEGGTIFTFGNTTRCSLKTVLIVHNPQFYWRVMTQADLGFADAYVNGDCSFVDKNEGLLHFFEICIANTYANRSVSNLNKKCLRGWWTPMLFTAIVSSAKLFFQHVSRQNTLTQPRRNISRHYDLSNELFALFLGETMQYSCGIFKKKDEDLDSAQQRKMSILIEKARITRKHEVLDIGCGWGFFAIELVKQTGCKYTGITLSDEQLKFAQKKVADAGLEDHIRFLLCDYRQLPNTSRFDRIISCEMIEHVGHDYMDDFFGCCDSVLAEDGIFVLQFIAILDEHYEEFRRSPGFMLEYIFPGGCMPSLSRATSAMAAASRLRVEHLENIGPHYFSTLRLWRKNFLENQSEITDLGFDEKFIRTWEYYFDYCAASFKTQIFNDYQVVFSRPGNAT
ncbi:hypothetical protein FEM48_Zijuj07G0095100 [Ziziphus jujuba var. spinosa]|uniref:Tuberculostearic acid methyltransferase UfaA1-like n=1 Tax=Ziziphus jujuba var. spinosa TaxID=714518 RepID=A0A978V3V1_ZIZJJ|nr:hypothetical protein FEM48_Zijuj07G0095100 [Ziziphus jujuba var. spinosa]